MADGENFAFANFDTIFRQVLKDLGLSRTVKAFNIVSKIDEPYFIISVKMGKARSAVQVKDMAQLTDSPQGVQITISDEEWAPALLTRLWQAYSKDRVKQLTRFEISIHDAKASDIENMELDPGEELKTVLLDAIWRVFPEGFKVRYDFVDNEVMTVVGTEHDMDDSWLEAARKVHELTRGTEAELNV